MAYLVNKPSSEHWGLGISCNCEISFRVDLVLIVRHKRTNADDKHPDNGNPMHFTDNIERSAWRKHSEKG